MADGIKAIAERAGVSISTVSRVMSGRSVRTASRQKVEAALREIDYRPNLAAQRLRSRRPRTIGLVVADITNRFFVDLVREINELAFAEGLNVLVADSREDPAREARCLAEFDREGVSGIVLAPARADAHPALARLARPLVLVDRTPDVEPFDSVGLDNQRAVNALIEHFARRGCRRIVGLFSAGTKTGAERSEAFRRAAHEIGLTAEAFALPFEAEVASCLGGDADGVLAGDARLLLSAAGALAAADRRPELAGFDVPVWAPLYREPLTVIRQPVEEIAHLALALLLARIADPARPPLQAMAAGHRVAVGAAAERNRPTPR